MTGVLNAMVGVVSQARYAITIGNNSSFYGFNRADAWGGISADLFRGKTIENIFSGTQVGSQFDIQIVIQTVVPQNFFGVLQVQDSAGVIRTYSSVSATYSTFGSSPVLTAWVWDSNNPVWTSTSPSPRALALY